MVNTTPSRSVRSTALPTATVLIAIYAAAVGCTLVALLVLALSAPREATTTAWVHTAIVAVFAILLPVRLRRARAGDRGAIRAVGLIAAALVLVNVVEAIIPGFVPVWMRVEMVVTAVLMLGVVLDVVRWAVVHKN